MMGGGNGGCQWLVVVVRGGSLRLQWVAVWSDQALLQPTTILKKNSIIFLLLFEPFP